MLHPAKNMAASNPISTVWKRGFMIAPYFVGFAACTTPVLKGQISLPTWIHAAPTTIAVLDRVAHDRNRSHPDLLQRA